MKSKRIVYNILLLFMSVFPFFINTEKPIDVVDSLDIAKRVMRQGLGGGICGYFCTGMFGYTQSGSVASGAQVIYDNAFSGSNSIVFSTPDTPAAGILYDVSGIAYMRGYNSNDGRNKTGWMPSRILIKKPGIYAIGYTVCSSLLNDTHPASPDRDCARTWALTVTPSASATNGVYTPGTGTIVPGSEVSTFKIDKTTYIREDSSYAANICYVTIPSLPNGQPVAIDITCVNFSDEGESNRLVRLEGGLSIGTPVIKNSVVAASLIILQIG